MLFKKDRNSADIVVADGIAGSRCRLHRGVLQQLGLQFFHMFSHLLIAQVKGQHLVLPETKIPGLHKMKLQVDNSGTRDQEYSDHKLKRHQRLAEEYGGLLIPLLSL